MKKALCWSVSICAVAGSLALAVPGTATAGSRPGVMALGPAFGGRLYGVSTPDSHDVFAVGLDGGDSLVVHWNGSRWSHTELPGGFLTGVAGSGPRDQWAVGGSNWFSPVSTTAWHWNGSSWRRVATPNPAIGGYFSAVAATSPSNAWAVGVAASGGPGNTGPITPLIEHWNGRHWTIQHFAEPADGGQFIGVTALSPSNAWAVGNTGDGTVQTTLIEHWNGKTWSRVPSPNVGSTVNSLHAITAKSSHNAWAVGSFFAADGSERTLALHWNGSQWTVVPTQSPGDDDAFISVTAAWTNNIWAVGYRNPTRCGGGPQCKTLVEHWNGAHWTLVASPNPPSSYLNILLGVRAASRTSVWAVGSTDYASTLIMHWNGTAWS